MEYQLGVWEPTPDVGPTFGVPEMQDAMMRVAGRSLGVNPRFVALGEALVAALPVAGPPDARKGVWPRDPLAAARRQGGGVWTVWLPDDPLLVCYRLVVKRALPLGLGVFDPQLLIYFSPDGRTLSATGMHDWRHIEREIADLLPPVLTVAWLERIVEAVSPLLVPRGFAIERPAAFRRDFVRGVEGGRQTVSVDIETLRGRYEAFLRCSIVDDACEDVVASIVAEPTTRRTLHFSTGFFDDSADGRQSVADDVAVRTVVDRLAGKPLAVLELARTRTGLDAALNEPERFPIDRPTRHPSDPRSLFDHCRHFLPDGVRALVMAWLVGRTDFDALVEVQRSKVHPDQTADREALDRAVRHLREHVPRGTR